MQIRFAEKEDLKYVANLSKNFAEENCCNGIVADDEKYFEDKKVAIAIDQDIVIGYAYGEIEKVKKDKSYIKKGQKVFYLEEMYVIPTERDRKVGKQLFEFIEREMNQKGVIAIELNAVSKDYSRLLNFYLKELNMSFLSAFLYKKI